MHLQGEVSDSASAIHLSTKRAGDEASPEGPGPDIHASCGAGICVGVVDEYPFTCECISSCLKLLRHDLRVLTFRSIDDCMIASTREFDLILFHMHCSSAEQSEQTIASLKEVFQLIPVVILSDIDNSNQVLQALESGARGYMPTGSTSVAVAAGVISLVIAGGTFVPPTSLHMIQASGSPPGSLTQRQVAVLHHMTRGKSNKIIAHELGMSESTVKVHVRSIMKKLRATNRTEAVFRARTLSAVQPQALTAPLQPRRALGEA